MSKSEGHAGKEFMRTHTGGEIWALLYYLCAGKIDVLKTVLERAENLRPEVVEAIRNNRLSISIMATINPP